MTTRTRPTMKSTLQNYDITPKLYRTYDDETLQRVMARYEAILSETEPADVAGREVVELRLSQLRRELARR